MLTHEAVELPSHAVELAAAGKHSQQANCRAALACASPGDDTGTGAGTGAAAAAVLVHQRAEQAGDQLMRVVPKLHGAGGAVVRQAQQRLDA